MATFKCDAEYFNTIRLQKVHFYSVLKTNPLCRVSLCRVWLCSIVVS